MPLFDHFRPPLSERRPWESFHSTWCSSLADHLNQSVLPEGYIALEQVHHGPAVEIDVGTFGAERPRDPGPNGGTTAVRSRVWTPATEPLALPGEFLQRYTVEVHSAEGGRTLVAAVELVSPGNKDREAKRRAFAAKCAAHLAQGVGLVVVDAVTTRRANLHNEMIDVLGMAEGFRWGDGVDIYAVAYRPLRRGQQDRIDTWALPLAVGEPLPTVPLSLSADLCLAVDLEAAYLDACRRRRVDEAAR